MPEPSSTQPFRTRSVSTCITIVLAVGAIAYVGFRASLALGREDLDRYESPLMLTVARQLLVGPRDLYGPFGGSNPLVLIHAPLYYRCAALVAWPMARAGLHPAEAARLSGRLISAVGLLLTMGAAYRLGRLGGLPRRSGWWSALLVACSPVLAGQPFAVRPDLAGVALQSWGAVLVLESLGGSGRRLGPASVLFGLSACVKQHLLGAWAVSVAFAAVGRLRGRMGSNSVERLVLPGAIVVALLYGAEWLVTGGRVWEAAFVAAANVGRVHPGGWLHVGTVVAAMAGKSAGLAALAVGGAIAARRWSSGWVPVAAGLLALSIVVLAAWQIAVPRPWLTGMLAVLALVALIIGLPIGVPPVRMLDEYVRIDAALGAYCGAELILLVILCRSSSGAWINYGIPAVVFAAALTARLLARALEVMAPPWRSIPAVAAVAVLASALMDTKVEVSRRRAEHGDLAEVFASTQLPPSAFFFADRPGLNRMSGRLEWVYDDWLYPAFESLKLAEPRARWLPPALGPPAGARAVVLDSDSPRIDGIREPLPALGFRLSGRFGSFRVWTFGYPSPGPR
jgi:hypothetical protein